MYLLKTKNYQLKTRQGFTLVETLIGSLIFVILAMAVYQAYAVVIGATLASRGKLAAVLLANERIEVIRNLPYNDVGTVGGTPAGLVPPEEVVVRDAFRFNLRTTIESLDDPFDGLAPTDQKPADYKRVNITVECSTCKSYTPVKLTTLVAPKNLEP